MAATLTLGTAGPASPSGRYGVEPGAGGAAEAKSRHVGLNGSPPVLAAYGPLAALRDDTPAVLYVARFPTDGKNRTALLPASGLPGGTVASFRCSGGTGCATVSATPLLN
jgi:hypothetical protein